MPAILVVDDDPDARFIIRTMIEFHGHTVLEAPDGTKALNILQRERPAMIFLDLMMPEMDGFAVLNHLQATPAWQNIPVVIVSAMQHQRLASTELPSSTHVLHKGNLSLESIRDALTAVPA